MAKEIVFTPDEGHHLDVLEGLARTQNWNFERLDDNEITILIGGKWSDYQISVTWLPEMEVLHLACAFDLKIQPPRLSEAQQLVLKINENLWSGHFDLWQKDGMIMHRTSMPLPAGMVATQEQYQLMLSLSLDMCEEYFPAFQFVVWAGKSAQEAIDAALFETKGEA